MFSDLFLFDIMLVIAFAVFCLNKLQINKADFGSGGKSFNSQSNTIRSRRLGRQANEQLGRLVLQIRQVGSYPSSTGLCLLRVGGDGSR